MDGGRFIGTQLLVDDNKYLGGLGYRVLIVELLLKCWWY